MRCSNVALWARGMLSYKKTEKIVDSYYDKDMGFLRASICQKALCSEISKMGGALLEKLTNKELAASLTQRLDRAIGVIFTLSVAMKSDVTFDGSCFSDVLCLVMEGIVQRDFGFSSGGFDLNDECLHVIYYSKKEEVVHAEMLEKLEERLFPFAEKYEKKSKTKGFKTLMRDALNLTTYAVSEYPTVIEGKENIMGMMKGVIRFFLDKYIFPVIEMEHGMFQSWKEPIAIAMAMTHLKRNEGNPLSEIEMSILMHIVDLI